MSATFDDILRRADRQNRKRVVISGENDPAALSALGKARDRGWVETVACGQSFAHGAPGTEVRFSSHPLEEARLDAMAMVRAGDAELLVDTGPVDPSFFSTINDKRVGIREGKVLSYINIFTAPKNGRLTMLTDTLINPEPDLKEKIGIVENIIRLARALGIERPKIAALAPLELVNLALQSTLDAAILSKMAERGQLGGAIIEGPLGMDNAESASAAIHKGISSPVPGGTDVYLFPDLESANLTAQFLAWVGQCQLCGILGGATVPIVICSPLEPPESWLLNLALGMLY